MPIYLVRWSLGRVSLVRATDANELTDLLDSCDTPNTCTWKMYDGPLWVDFDLPGIERCCDRPGPPDVDDFSFRRADGAFPTLKPHFFPYTDAHDEMCDAMLKWAFPNLWKSIDRIIEHTGGAAECPRDASDEAALSSAVSRDEVRHCDRLLEKDVTYDASMRLIPVRNWYLLRNPEGFVRVPVPKVERFCYGRAKLRPDGDGYVRLALLKSHWSDDRTHVVFTGAIRLRAGSDGTIDSVHRADAFGATEGAEVAPHLFEARRNAAVAWTLADDDWNHLAEFFRKKFGPGVELAQRQE